MGRVISGGCRRHRSENAVEANASIYAVLEKLRQDCKQSCYESESKKTMQFGEKLGCKLEFYTLRVLLSDRETE